VGRRWKYLIAIGLSVAVLDQWTKFLAVEHLTPGIPNALFATESTAISLEDKKRALDELGFFQALSLFYGAVKEPCAQPQARCPAVGVVSGFWNWRYVENKGAAWGLLASATEAVRVPFFILVSVVAIAFIITFFRKLPDSQLLLVISLSLVFGGAIGNFIDRLHLNYVIDFVDWYIGTSHWPTFNFADAAITTGVALLVIQWIRDWAAGKDKNNDEEKQQSSAESSAGGVG
jgi:signal peptidase II